MLNAMIGSGMMKVLAEVDNLNIESFFALQYS